MTNPDPDLTALDARARAAARALNASVAATVAPDRLLPALPPRGRRRGGSARWLPAVAAVALLGGVVAVAATRDPQPTDRVQTDEPDPDGDAPGLELAGPRDGRDSVALPVTVTPADGLADGDVVAVAATGFEPGEQVGVVLCGSEAGPPLRLGVDACNIGTVVYAYADDDGAVAAEIAVARTVTTTITGTIDCAAEAGRCIVAVGALDDYDRSGGGVVSFVDGLTPIDLPAAAVTPAEGLGEGDVVELSGTGAPAGRDVTVMQCAFDPRVCVNVAAPGADPFGGLATVAGDGSFRVEVQVWRYLPGAQRGTYVDCTLSVCTLTASFTTILEDGRPVPTGPTRPTDDVFPADGGSLSSVAPVPVAFVDDGSEPPLPPVLSVSPTSGIEVGSELEVSGVGFTPGDELYIELCGAGVGGDDAGYCGGTAVEPVAIGDDGTFSFVVTVRDDLCLFAADEERCGFPPGRDVVIDVVSSLSASGARSFLPEPVPVTLVG